MPEVVYCTARGQSGVHISRAYRSQLLHPPMKNGGPIRACSGGICAT